jgi:hypothetical protein
MWIPRLLKQITEIVRAETAIVCKAIKEQEDTARESGKAAEANQREIAGGIASAIKTAHEEVPAYEKTQRDKEYRQQYKMVWAAWFTFGAAFAYGAVAAWQGYLMRGTYREIQKQTRAAEHSVYESCLSAQVAQATLVQVQNGAAYSRAMAEASAEQTVANVALNRSFVVIDAKLPTPSEVLGPDVSAPFSVINEGKADAVGLNFGVAGVLVGPGDSLRLNKIQETRYLVGRIPGGDEWPSQKDPRRKPPIPSFNLRDTRGNFVPRSSNAAVQLLQEGAAKVFIVGHETYTDFTGTHTSRFCYPLWTMKANTMRSAKADANDLLCAKYTDAEDHYKTPNIEAPIPSPPIRPITCQAPKD